MLVCCSRLYRAMRNEQVRVEDKEWVTNESDNAFRVVASGIRIGFFTRIANRALRIRQLSLNYLDGPTKMSRTVAAVLLLVVAYVCASSVNANCPPNEEYKTCGTACEPRCGKPAPHFCSEECVRGCQCVKGYVRNSVDRCVLPGKC